MMVPEVEKPQITEIHVRMDCNGCVQKIRKALHGINGIYDLYIDFPQQKLTIIGWADPEKIVKAIKKTRKTATILCSHTEQPTEPAPPPPSEQPPEGGAPPASHDAANPPPTEAPPPAEGPPPPEAAPPAEPPKEPPPPEHPPPEAEPTPLATETNPGQQHPVYHQRPRDVGEVHTIYHHQQPDYGYRYGYTNGYAGYWNRYHNSQGHPPEPTPPPAPAPAPAPVPIVVQAPPPAPMPAPPIYVTHSYNTYRPSPYVTEYEYIQPPPQQQTHFSRINQYHHYNEDQPYQNVSNGNGNFTSIFSDENPNACNVM